MPRARPPSIDVFAICFLAQALGGAIHNIVSPASMLFKLENEYQVSDAWPYFAAIIGARLLVAGIVAGMVYFRASVAAKWFAVLLALGRVYQFGDAWTGLRLANPHSIAWMAEFAIGVLASASLFTPGARKWFARKGRTIAEDREVFE